MKHKNLFAGLLAGLMVAGISAAEAGGPAPEQEQAPVGKGNSVLSAFEAMGEQDLADQSGRNNIFGVANVGQQNDTDQNNKNKNSPVITSDGSSKTNGMISAATVTGNRGIVMVTQNTGDVVNISKNMNVNVYLK